MPSVLIGLPLEERHHTVDRGGGCFGVDTQVDPPILLPPFTSDGRLADTYPRQPDTLTHHVNPIRWVGHRNDGRRGLHTHHAGLAAEREGGRSILAVYINTTMSSSLLFPIETDERTTSAISSPPDRTSILPRYLRNPPTPPSPLPPSKPPWGPACQ